MPTSRRSFLQATAASATVLTGSVLGANDRIRGAVIGTGNRGGSMGRAMALHEGTDIAVVCDVDQSRMEAFVNRLKLENAEFQADWRRVIDRKDIDAVIITTPDHWHSPITIAALEAGKHVYVEKPLSNTVVGGRQDAGSLHSPPGYEGAGRHYAAQRRALPGSRQIGARRRHWQCYPGSRQPR